MRPVSDASPLPVHGTVVEIRTMFSSRADAEACAARLVGARLAACVQIDGPVTSVYRWAGEVQTADEYRCTCKTSPGRAEACAAALLEDHGYELPELVACVTFASPAYAEWVRASVAVGT